MATINIPKGTKITKEVREAIEKKLKELEEQSAQEGTAQSIEGEEIRLNSNTAAWSVNYTT